LVLVSIKLGLVSEFELAKEPNHARLFDPGSTISIVAREHQQMRNNSVRITLEHAHLNGNEDGDEEGDDDEDDGEHPEGHHPSPEDTPSPPDSPTHHPPILRDTSQERNSEKPAFFKHHQQQHHQHQQQEQYQQPKIKFAVSTSEDNLRDSLLGDPRLAAIEDWLFADQKRQQQQHHQKQQQQQREPRGQSDVSSLPNHHHVNHSSVDTLVKPSAAAAGGGGGSDSTFDGTTPNSSDGPSDEPPPFFAMLFDLKGVKEQQQQQEDYREAAANSSDAVSANSSKDSKDHNSSFSSHHSNGSFSNNAKQSAADVSAPKRVRPLKEGLRRDVLEFYRELLILLEFGEQNGVTLRKLLKKHRKELGGRLDQAPPLKDLLGFKCPFREANAAGAAAASTTATTGAAAATSTAVNDAATADTSAARVLTQKSKESALPPGGGVGVVVGGGGGQAALRHLVATTESLYIEGFASHGTAKERKKAAMKFLAVDHVASAGEMFGTWRFGGALGIAAVVGVLIIYLSNFRNARADPGGLVICDYACSAAVVSLYRLSGMGLLFSWVWFACGACSLHFRVDYAVVSDADGCRLWTKLQPPSPLHTRTTYTPACFCLVDSLSHLSLPCC
jgi:hypothetical protein